MSNIRDKCIFMWLSLVFKVKSLRLKVRDLREHHLNFKLTTLNLFPNPSIRKLIALTIAFIFFFVELENSCYGQVATSVQSLLSEDKVQSVVLDSETSQVLSERHALLKQIVIPDEFGKLESISISDSETNVLFLQDAHGQLDAQDHLYELIHYLQQNYGFEALFLEGGLPGSIGHDWLEFYQSQEVNKKIVETLYEEGKIGGPGKYLFEQQEGLDAYGVEDRDIYFRNLLSYRRVYSRSKLVQKFLNDYELDLLTTASNVFNAELLAFAKQWLAFQDRQDDILHHMSVLKKYVKKYLKLDLGSPRYQDRYPQLIRFYKLQEVEKKMKAGGFLEKSESERNELLEWLRQAPIEEATADFFRLVLSKDTRDIPKHARRILEVFYDAARHEGFRWEDYPHLNVRLSRIILNQEMDGLSLFKEIHDATHKLMDRLAESEEEKTLIRLYKDYWRLNQLFQLELTHADYQDIVERLGELSPDRMRERLGNAKSQVTSHKTQGNLNNNGDVSPREASPSKKRRWSNDKNVDREMSLWDQSPKVSQTFQEARRFYDLAIKRDEIIFQHMQKQIQEKGLSRVLLVAGGFHTEGMKSILKEHEISYGIVTPRIGLLSEKDMYVDTMMLRSKEVPQLSRVVATNPARMQIRNMELRDANYHRNAVERIAASFTKTHDLKPGKGFRWHGFDLEGVPGERKESRSPFERQLEGHSLAQIMTLVDDARALDISNATFESFGEDVFGGLLNNYNSHVEDINARLKQSGVSEDEYLEPYDGFVDIEPFRVRSFAENQGTKGNAIHEITKNATDWSRGAEQRASKHNQGALMLLGELRPYIEGEQEDYIVIETRLDPTQTQDRDLKKKGAQGVRIIIWNQSADENIKEYKIHLEFDDSIRTGTDISLYQKLKDEKMREVARQRRLRVLKEKLRFFADGTVEVEDEGVLNQPENYDYVVGPEGRGVRNEDVSTVKVRISGDGWGVGDDGVGMSVKAVLENFLSPGESRTKKLVSEQRVTTDIKLLAKQEKATVAHISFGIKGHEIEHSNNETEPHLNVLKELVLDFPVGTHAGSSWNAVEVEELTEESFHHVIEQLTNPDNGIHNRFAVINTLALAIRNIQDNPGATERLLEKLREATQALITTQRRRGIKQHFVPNQLKVEGLPHGWSAFNNDVHFIPLDEALFDFDWNSLEADETLFQDVDVSFRAEILDYLPPDLRDMPIRIANWSLKEAANKTVTWVKTENGPVVLIDPEAYATHREESIILFQDLIPLWSKNMHEAWQNRIVSQDEIVEEVVEREEQPDPFQIPWEEIKEWGKWLLKWTVLTAVAFLIAYAIVYYVIPYFGLLELWDSIALSVQDFFNALGSSFEMSEPQASDTQTPDTQTPDTQTPDTQTPDTQTSGTQGTSSSTDSSSSQTSTSEETLFDKLPDAPEWLTEWMPSMPKIPFFAMPNWIQWALTIATVVVIAQQFIKRFFSGSGQSLRDRIPTRAWMKWVALVPLMLFGAPWLFNLIGGVFGNLGLTLIGVMIPIGMSAFAVHLVFMVLQSLASGNLGSQSVFDGDPRARYEGWEEAEDDEGEGGPVHPIYLLLVIPTMMATLAANMLLTMLQVLTLSAPWNSSTYGRIINPPSNVDMPLVNNFLVRLDSDGKPVPAAKVVKRLRDESILPERTRKNHPDERKRRNATEIQLWGDVARGQRMALLNYPYGLIPTKDIKITRRGSDSELREGEDWIRDGEQIVFNVSQEVEIHYLIDVYRAEDLIIDILDEKDDEVDMTEYPLPQVEREGLRELDKVLQEKSPGLTLTKVREQTTDDNKMKVIRNITHRHGVYSLTAATSGRNFARGSAASWAQSAANRIGNDEILQCVCDTSSLFTYLLANGSGMPAMMGSVTIPTMTGKFKTSKSGHAVAFVQVKRNGKTFWEYEETTSNLGRGMPSLYVMLKKFINGVRTFITSILRMPNARVNIWEILEGMWRWTGGLVIAVLSLLWEFIRDGWEWNQNRRENNQWEARIKKERAQNSAYVKEVLDALELPPHAHERVAFNAILDAIDKDNAEPGFFEESSHVSFAFERTSKVGVEKERELKLFKELFEYYRSKRGEVNNSAVGEEWGLAFLAHRLSLNLSQSRDRVSLFVSEIEGNVAHSIGRRSYLRTRYQDEENLFERDLFGSEPLANLLRTGSPNGIKGIEDSVTLTRPTGNAGRDQVDKFEGLREWSPAFIFFHDNNIRRNRRLVTLVEEVIETRLATGQMAALEPLLVQLGDSASSFPRESLIRILEYLRDTENLEEQAPQVTQFLTQFSELGMENAEDVINRLFLLLKEEPEIAMETMNYILSPVEGVDLTELEDLDATLERNIAAIPEPRLLAEGATFDLGGEAGHVLSLRGRNGEEVYYRIRYQLGKVEVLQWDDGKWELRGNSSINKDILEANAESESRIPFPGIADFESPLKLRVKKGLGDVLHVQVESLPNAIEEVNLREDWGPSLVQMSRVQEHLPWMTEEISRAAPDGNIPIPLEVNQPTRIVAEDGPVAFVSETSDGQLRTYELHYDADQEHWIMTADAPFQHTRLTDAVLEETVPVSTNDEYFLLEHDPEQKGVMTITFKKENTTLTTVTYTQTAVEETEAEDISLEVRQMRFEESVQRSIVDGAEIGAGEFQHFEPTGDSIQFEHNGEEHVYIHDGDSWVRVYATGLREPVSGTVGGYRQMRQRQGQQVVVTVDGERLLITNASDAIGEPMTLDVRVVSNWPQVVSLPKRIEAAEPRSGEIGVMYSETFFQNEKVTFELEGVQHTFVYDENVWKYESSNGRHEKLNPGRGLNLSLAREIGFAFRHTEAGNLAIMNRTNDNTSGISEQAIKFQTELVTKQDSTIPVVSSAGNGNIPVHGTIHFEPHVQVQVDVKGKSYIFRNIGGEWIRSSSVREEGDIVLGRRSGADKRGPDIGLRTFKHSSGRLAIQNMTGLRPEDAGAEEVSYTATARQKLETGEIQAGASETFQNDEEIVFSVSGIEHRLFHENGIWWHVVSNTSVQVMPGETVAIEDITRRIGVALIHDPDGTLTLENRTNEASAQVTEQTIEFSKRQVEFLTKVQSGKPQNFSPTLGSIEFEYQNKRYVYSHDGFEWFRLRDNGLREVVPVAELEQVHKFPNMEGDVLVYVGSQDQQLKIYYGPADESAEDLDVTVYRGLREPANDETPDVMKKKGHLIEGASRVALPRDGYISFKAGFIEQIYFYWNGTWYHLLGTEGNSEPVDQQHKGDYVGDKVRARVTQDNSLWVSYVDEIAGKSSVPFTHFAGDLSQSPNELVAQAVAKLRAAAETVPSEETQSGTMAPGGDVTISQNQTITFEVNNEHHTFHYDFERKEWFHVSEEGNKRLGWLSNRSLQRRSGFEYTEENGTLTLRNVTRVPHYVGAEQSIEYTIGQVQAPTIAELPERKVIEQVTLNYQGSREFDPSNHSIELRDSQVPHVFQHDGVDWYEMHPSGVRQIVPIGEENAFSTKAGAVAVHVNANGQLVITDTRQDPRIGWAQDINVYNRPQERTVEYPNLIQKQGSLPPGQTRTFKPGEAVAILTLPSGKSLRFVFINEQWYAEQDGENGKYAVFRRQTKLDRSDGKSVITMHVTLDNELQFRNQSSGDEAVMGSFQSLQGDLSDTPWDSVAPTVEGIQSGELVLLPEREKVRESKIEAGKGKRFKDQSVTYEFQIGETTYRYAYSDGHWFRLYSNNMGELISVINSRDELKFMGARAGSAPVLVYTSPDGELRIMNRTNKLADLSHEITVHNYNRLPELPTDEMPGIHRRRGSVLPQNARTFAPEENDIVVISLGGKKYAFFFMDGSWNIAENGGRSKVLSLGYRVSNWMKVNDDNELEFSNASTLDEPTKLGFEWYRGDFSLIPEGPVKQSIDNARAALSARSKMGEFEIEAGEHDRFDNQSVTYEFQVGEERYLYAYSDGDWYRLHEDGVKEVLPDVDSGEEYNFVTEGVVTVSAYVLKDQKLRIANFTDEGDGPKQKFRGFNYNRLPELANDETPDLDKRRGSILPQHARKFPPQENSVAGTVIAGYKYAFFYLNGSWHIAEDDARSKVLQPGYEVANLMKINEDNELEFSNGSTLDEPTEFKFEWYRGDLSLLPEGPVKQSIDNVRGSMAALAAVADSLPTSERRLLRTRTLEEGDESAEIKPEEVVEFDIEGVRYVYRFDEELSSWVRYLADGTQQPLDLTRINRIRRTNGVDIGLEVRGANLLISHPMDLDSGESFPLYITVYAAEPDADTEVELQTQEFDENQTVVVTSQNFTHVYYYQDGSWFFIGSDGNAVEVSNQISRRHRLMQGLNLNARGFHPSVAPTGNLVISYPQSSLVDSFRLEINSGPRLRPQSADDLGLADFRIRTFAAHEIVTVTVKDREFLFYYEENGWRVIHDISNDNVATLPVYESLGILRSLIDENGFFASNTGRGSLDINFPASSENEPFNLRVSSEPRRANWQPPGIALHTDPSSRAQPRDLIATVPRTAQETYISKYGETLEIKDADVGSGSVEFEQSGFTFTYGFDETAHRWFRLHPDGFKELISPRQEYPNQTLNGQLRLHAVSTLFMERPVRNNADTTDWEVNRYSSLPEPTQDSNPNFDKWKGRINANDSREFPPRESFITVDVVGGIKIDFLVIDDQWFQVNRSTGEVSLLEPEQRIAIDGQENGFIYLEPRTNLLRVYVKDGTEAWVDWRHSVGELAAHSDARVRESAAKARQLLEPLKAALSIPAGLPDEAGRAQPRDFDFESLPDIGVGFYPADYEQTAGGELRTQGMTVSAAVHSGELIAVKDEHGNYYRYEHDGDRWNFISATGSSERVPRREELQERDSDTWRNYVMPNGDLVVENVSGGAGTPRVSITYWKYKPNFIETFSLENQQLWKKDRLRQDNRQTEIPANAGHTIVVRTQGGNYYLFRSDGTSWARVNQSGESNEVVSAKTGLGGVGSSLNEEGDLVLDLLRDDSTQIDYWIYESAEGTEVSSLPAGQAGLPRPAPSSPVQSRGVSDEPLPNFGKGFNPEEHRVVEKGVFNQQRQRRVLLPLQGNSIALYFGGGYWRYEHDGEHWIEISSLGERGAEAVPIRDTEVTNKRKVDVYEEEQGGALVLIDVTPDEQRDSGGSVADYWIYDQKLPDFGGQFNQDDYSLERKDRLSQGDPQREIPVSAGQTVVVRNGPRGDYFLFQSDGNKWTQMHESGSTLKTDDKGPIGFGEFTRSFNDDGDLILKRIPADDVKDVEYWIYEEGPSSRAQSRDLGSESLPDFGVGFNPNENQLIGGKGELYKDGVISAESESGESIAVQYLGNYLRYDYDGSHWYETDAYGRKHRVQLESEYAPDDLERLVAYERQDGSIVVRNVSGTNATVEVIINYWKYKPRTDTSSLPRPLQWADEEAGRAQPRDLSSEPLPDFGVGFNAGEHELVEKGDFDDFGEERSLYKDANESIAVLDKNGNATRFEYDGEKWITIDHEGHEYLVEYDAYPEPAEEHLFFEAYQTSEGKLVVEKIDKDSRDTDVFWIYKKKIDVQAALAGIPDVDDEEDTPELPDFGTGWVADDHEYVDRGDLTYNAERTLKAEDGAIAVRTTQGHFRYEWNGSKWVRIGQDGVRSDVPGIRSTQSGHLRVYVTDQNELVVQNVSLPSSPDGSIYAYWRYQRKTPELPEVNWEATERTLMGTRHTKMKRPDTIGSWTNDDYVVNVRDSSGKFLQSYIVREMTTGGEKKWYVYNPDIKEEVAVGRKFKIEGRNDTFLKDRRGKLEIHIRGDERVLDISSIAPESTVERLGNNSSQVLKPEEGPFLFNFTADGESRTLHLSQDDNGRWMLSDLVKETVTLLQEGDDINLLPGSDSAISSLSLRYMQGDRISVGLIDASEPKIRVYMQKRAPSLVLATSTSPTAPAAPAPSDPSPPAPTPPDPSVMSQVPTVSVPAAEDEIHTVQMGESMQFEANSGPIFIRVKLGGRIIPLIATKVDANWIIRRGEESQVLAAQGSLFVQERNYEFMESTPTAYHNHSPIHQADDGKLFISLVREEEELQKYFGDAYGPMQIEVITNFQAHYDDFIGNYDLTRMELLPALATENEEAQRHFQDRESIYVDWLLNGGQLEIENNNPLDLEPTDELLPALEEEKKKDDVGDHWGLTRGGLNVGRLSEINDERNNRHSLAWLVDAAKIVKRKKRSTKVPVTMEDVKSGVKEAVQRSREKAKVSGGARLPQAQRKILQTSSKQGRTRMVMIRELIQNARDAIAENRKALMDAGKDPRIRVRSYLHKVAETIGDVVRDQLFWVVSVFDPVGMDLNTLFYKYFPPNATTKSVEESLREILTRENNVVQKKKDIIDLLEEEYRDDADRDSFILDTLSSGKSSEEMAQALVKYYASEFRSSLGAGFFGIGNYTLYENADRGLIRTGKDGKVYEVEVRVDRNDANDPKKVTGLVLLSFKEYEYDVNDAEQREEYEGTLVQHYKRTENIPQTEFEHRKMQYLFMEYVGAIDPGDAIIEYEREDGSPLNVPIHDTITERTRYGKKHPVSVVRSAKGIIRLTVARLFLKGKREDDLYGFIPVWLRSWMDDNKLGLDFAAGTPVTEDRTNLADPEAHRHTAAVAVMKAAVAEYRYDNLDLSHLGLPPNEEFLRSPELHNDFLNDADILEDARRINEGEDFVTDAEAQQGITEDTKWDRYLNDKKRYAALLLMIRSSTRSRGSVSMGLPDLSEQESLLEQKERVLFRWVPPWVREAFYENEALRTRFKEKSPPAGLPMDIVSSFGGIQEDYSTANALRLYLSVLELYVEGKISIEGFPYSLQEYLDPDISNVVADETTLRDAVSATIYRETPDRYTDYVGFIDRYQDNPDALIAFLLSIPVRGGGVALSSINHEKDKVRQRIEEAKRRAREEAERKAREEAAEADRLAAEATRERGEVETAADFEPEGLSSRAPTDDVIPRGSEGRTEGSQELPADESEIPPLSRQTSTESVGMTEEPAIDEEVLKQEAIAALSNHVTVEPSTYTIVSSFNAFLEQAVTTVVAHFPEEMQEQVRARIDFKLEATYLDHEGSDFQTLAAFQDFAEGGSGRQLFETVFDHTITTTSTEVFGDFLDSFLQDVKTVANLRDSIEGRGELEASLNQFRGFVEAQDRDKVVTWSFERAESRKVVEQGQTLSLAGGSDPTMSFPNDSVGNPAVSITTDAQRLALLVATQPSFVAQRDVAGNAAQGVIAVGGTRFGPQLMVALWPGREQVRELTVEEGARLQDSIRNSDAPITVVVEVPANLNADEMQSLLEGILAAFDQKEQTHQVILFLRASREESRRFESRLTKSLDALALEMDLTDPRTLRSAIHVLNNTRFNMLASALLFGRDIVVVSDSSSPLYRMDMSTLGRSSNRVVMDQLPDGSSLGLDETASRNALGAFVTGAFETRLLMTGDSINERTRSLLQGFDEAWYARSRDALSRLNTFITAMLQTTLLAEQSA